MKKIPKIHSAILGIIFAAAATLFLLLSIQFKPFYTSLTALENLLYDYRLRFQIDASPAYTIEDVVIIDIDEASLQELGWLSQWPRAYFGQVVDSLAIKGARAIGFDVIYAETDRMQPDVQQFHVQQIAPKTGLAPAQIRLILQSLSTDSVFAAKIAKAGNIYLASHLRDRHLNDDESQTYADSIGRLVSYSLRPDLIKDFTTQFEFSYKFTNQSMARLKEEHLPAELCETLDTLTHELPLSKKKFLAQVKKWIGDEQTNQYKTLLLKHAYYENKIYVPPIAILGYAAKGIGLANVDPDDDGVTRRYPIFFHYNDKNLVNFATQMIFDLMGEDATTFSIDPRRGIIGQHCFFPTDEQGNLLLRYYGPPKTFRTIPFKDVLLGRVNYNFNDKIYLLGTSALGLEDLKTTPFSVSTYPGVELHATAIYSILKGDFIWKARFFPTTVLIAFILAMTLSFTIYHMRPIGAVLVSFSIIILFIIGCFIIFYLKSLWVEITFPMVAATITLIIVITYQYWAEEKDKRQIRGLFNSYVSPQIAEKMIHDPSSIRFGGEKRMLTVMFSDIRGFTTMSEMLGSEVVVSFLNEYLTAMHDIVNKYDGTLDKYIGDAVMAIFGAPIDQKDHAARACQTALDMIARIDELNSGWVARQIPAIRIGIGINTGGMHVGNMGSKQRFDYTVMGDNVNLASRLEGLNKYYATTIIVGLETYQATKDHFLYRELDLVRVKGKQLPVHIYELLGRDRNDPNWKEFIPIFEQGIYEMRIRNWPAAVERFQTCAKIRPADTVTAMYLERCTELQAKPPLADWDGSWVMTEK